MPTPKNSFPGNTCQTCSESHHEALTHVLDGIIVFLGALILVADSLRGEAMCFFTSDEHVSHFEWMRDH